MTSAKQAPDSAWRIQSQQETCRHIKYVEILGYDTLYLAYTLEGGVGNFERGEGGAAQN
jgi:hypothetical protein